MEKMSVNPEETVCGGKTVTETDIYLCFGKSIEELYAHNSQQQKCFQPQFVEEWSYALKLVYPKRTV